jgi:Icc-related predicted phosphoesterase
MEKKLKILAAGDLHGNFDVTKKLSAKAKKNNVDLVILAGDIHGYSDGKPGILDVFSKAGQKVIFVPGNCDFDEELDDLTRAAKNIHNSYVVYDGVGIAGIGSGNWKLLLDEGDFVSIQNNFSRMKSPKKILVSHLHAKDSLAEFSGIPGDEVVLKAIKEFGPDLLIAAHIHEGEGIEDIMGKTRIVQVGKKGTILEI